MPREDLAAASEALQQAAMAAADDPVRRRIYDQSESVAQFASADRRPDAKRLTRAEDDLRELVEATRGEARDHVEQALEYVESYRGAEHA